MFPTSVLQSTFLAPAGRQAGRTLHRSVILFIKTFRSSGALDISSFFSTNKLPLRGYFSLFKKPSINQALTSPSFGGVWGGFNAYFHPDQ